MLKFYFLNVGHGDSIVLEHIDENGKVSFGLIDSNTPHYKEQPAALFKLQSLNADILSFVALTHPDSDHYSGLVKVLNHFKGKIGNFYTFPVGPYIEGRLQKLAETYSKYIDEVYDDVIRSKSLEFIEILKYAKDNFIKNNKWEEPVGFKSLITPDGFNDVDIFTLLPGPNVKGRYIDLIESKNIDFVNPNKTNDLSLAFLVQYKGRSVILGGDGTKKNWMINLQKFRDKKMSLEADAVKLPHHGSKIDNTNVILSHFYDRDELGHQQYAIISANGQSHPSVETLTSIQNKKIHPYCTSLSQHCRLPDGLDQESLDHLDPILGRFLTISRECFDDIAPCQGEVILTIDHDGNFTIDSENKVSCIYRGDYDFMFSI